MYGLDTHCPEPKDWFLAWYAENIAKQSKAGEDTCCELLYPCYYFNHAPGVAAITKHLACNMCGHIEEKCRQVSILFITSTTSGKTA